MLLDLEYSHGLFNHWKNGAEPSAIKLQQIANYLEVSIDYLLGNTDDPTPPKKELTRQDKLNIEISMLTPEKRKQAEQFVEFLKIQESAGQELSESLSMLGMRRQPE